MGRPGRQAAAGRPAVFLDRDGTLLDESAGPALRPEAVRLLPGAAEATARLRAAGFRVVVVTNQSAIARGLLTEARLADIHQRMAAAGLSLDGVFHCPHLAPAAGGRVAPYAASCDCRKPLAGLWRRAAEALGPLDLGASFSVGDDGRDLAAGRAAGTRTVLVLTGKGRETFAGLGPGAADHVAEDVLSAATWCLAQSRAGRTDGDARSAHQ